MYVLGKRIWRSAFRTRKRASFTIAASGPWEQRQGSASGKVLGFELRPGNGAKAWSHRGQLSTVWLVVVGLVGGAVAGGLAFKFLPHFEVRSGAVASSVSFRLCGSSAAENCVVDGDTIHWGGIKIRLADIDTPEISSPKCSSELALGQKAKLRLLDLLNAGPFEVAATGGRDEDVYGRKLRLITRDGRSLGNVLIAEGLARRWDGARRSWC
ncbi:thermonuclease family protein (plasmid) [Microvirga sp. VF16]|nr:thermonuclease family protein [Microvirga sp. VF16]